MQKVKRTGALPPPPASALKEALGSKDINIEWLAGDGSDRCYYRIYPENGPSVVLMQLSGSDAEALKAGGYEWIEMAAILEQNKVLVPNVIATLPDYAALIIEDYGQQMLEGLVWSEGGLNTKVDRQYQTAVKIIRKFLRISEDTNSIWCQRAFDSSRLQWELDFFKEKYLSMIASLPFSKAQQITFDKETKILSETLGKHAHYFTHRDYHSRNIMVLDSYLAVIDFQDARLGPPAYDLVSLLFDSYVPFKNEDRMKLFDTALELFSEKMGSPLIQEIRDTWKATLLQRQYKAIGSFGFLTLEKNRGEYLKYVGPALLTLKENQVYDSRWPFLSGDLIDIIIEHLSGIHHGKPSV